MKKLQIYVDTSVVGGCCDEEFKEASLALMRMVKSGGIQMVVSELLLRELEEAPENVRSILADLPQQHVEGFLINEEVESSMRLYLQAEVLGPNQKNDALHVALAGIANVDMILSWNFKHIVHYDKIRGFSAVNLREGYQPLEIRSPKEVV